MSYIEAAEIPPRTRGEVVAELRRLREWLYGSTGDDVEVEILDACMAAISSWCMHEDGRHHPWYSPDVEQTGPGYIGMVSHSRRCQICGIARENI